MQRKHQHATNIILIACEKEASCTLVFHFGYEAVNISAACTVHSVVTAYTQHICTLCLGMKYSVLMKTGFIDIHFSCTEYATRYVSAYYLLGNVHQVSSQTRPNRQTPSKSLLMCDMKRDTQRETTIWCDRRDRLATGFRCCFLFTASGLHYCTHYEI